MSRVLLFTQTGDARPKVAKQFGVRLAWADLYFAKIKFGEPGQPDRGWLVECENAEQGRACIALSQRTGGVRTVFKDTVFVDAGTIDVQGRILASGGKR